MKRRLKMQLLQIETFREAAKDECAEEKHDWQERNESS